MTKAAHFFTCILYFAMAGHLHADPGPMALWFTGPSTPGNINSWSHHALPIGNGKLAAMVYGAVGSDQIQFNEDTIWSGQPHYYENTNSTPAHLASIRAKCFNHTDILSESQPYLMSVPFREASYQDAGSLVLSFPHSGTANYRRTLDLNTATVNVRYDFGGVTYNRDVFASAPSNKVIAVRFTASQSAKITFTCSLSTQQSATFSTIGNELVMRAKVIGSADSRYHAAGLTNAVRFDARVRLIATGGAVTVGSSSLSVTNADEVTLLLAVASNVKSYNDLTADYVNICSNNIVGAAAMSYGALRQAQQDDYKNLYNRVVLDLGGNSRTNQDIGFRKRQIAIDGEDPQLVALDFQLGRYLTIAGSRPGSQPLNLQGKWNSKTNLGNDWDSKLTLNINQQMNYWGAEVCNLSECHEPLFDMIQDLSVTGHRVAGTNYFCDGWVAHHNTDLWRGAAAVNGRDGNWTTGGAWLCQHLWWHFLYTGDTNWLATTGYPLMKSAAQFFEDFLIHPPVGGAFPLNTNWLVTNPSYSPEHGLPSDAENVPGVTMDNELLRDLFSNVIEASQVLGIDAAFRTNVAALRDQLPPDQIGSGGQLQEWLEDVDGGAGYDNGHRHCSHLVGLFPGEEISSFYTPALAQAARVSVDRRGYGNSSMTPWGISWRVNLRNRLQDGDGAFTNLVYLYGYNKVSTNLIFADGHQQMDSIFGRLSGIAEMFLQSQSGEVFLLPALPSKFTNGVVSGLCARGGFQVDNMSWTNGRLTGATILSKIGNTCRLRSKWPIDVKLGSNYVSAPMVLPGLYQFSTVAGSNYTIIPAAIAEAENLSVTTSAGDAHQVFANAAFSNLRGARLNASAPGDFVTYTITNLSMGSYQLLVVADAGQDRAQFQLAVGPGGGSFTNVGSAQDTYSPTNIAYLLASRFNRLTNGQIAATSTNAIILWTNMLKEFDCGTWQAPSNGNYQFKFSVVDKNAGSSGYMLAFDHIKFTPATGTPPSNQPPTDISLSNSTVTENQSAGADVGALGTTDPDSGNTFTYTLASGDGDTNNTSFTIIGNTLQTAAAFDFETKNSYSVRVASTDQGGLSVEKAFTITVTDTNEAPTDIFLSNASVMENEPAGTVVGNLSTGDPDSSDTFTYSLVVGTGSESNSFFTVNGPPIQIIGPFDGDSANTTVSIRVRSTDAGGLYTEKAFLITVLNTNEAPFTPTNLVPDNAAIALPLTPTLQASPFNDQDIGDSHAASQWLVRKSSDSSIVFDSGENSTNKTSLPLPPGVLDYVTTYNWQTRYEDSHNVWSDYSTPTTFSTVAPNLIVTVENGELLLSWPTNSAGFSLEYTAEFPAPDWLPVSPLPAIVDGQNVVTNVMDGENIFYRLNKP